MVLGKYAHIFFAILYVLVGNEPCIADTPELKAAENRTDFKFKALELSNELIDKLKSDTKFTIDDERKFFGGVSNIYSFTSIFYQKFAYIRYEATDNCMKAVMLKPLPKSSFIGQTLRLYRNLFFEEGNSPMLTVGDSYYANSQNNLTPLFPEYIYVYIQPKPNDSHLIRLCHSIRHGFFGKHTNKRKNILTYLNITSKHDKSRLSDQFLELMHNSVK